MAREGFSGHLDLLLLTTVRRQALHGYAIIEHVRAASAGQFDYAEGTIYPALRRLEDDGLLRSRWSDAGPRRRRLYALTAKGGRALDGQREEWARYIGAVEGVLGHG